MTQQEYLKRMAGLMAQQQWASVTAAPMQQAMATAMSGNWITFGNGLVQGRETLEQAAERMAPDGVPGSYPLEKILDGLEKSGPERIKEFL